MAQKVIYDSVDSAKSVSPEDKAMNRSFWVSMGFFLILVGAVCVNLDAIDEYVSAAFQFYALVFAIFTTICFPLVLRFTMKPKVK